MYRARKAPTNPFSITLARDGVASSESLPLHFIFLVELRSPLNLPSNKRREILYLDIVTRPSCVAFKAADHWIAALKTARKGQCRRGSA
jgi:hypothetical protein